MTKAERIFKATYYESMTHVKRWGFERGSRWTGLNTDERLCTRTLNAIDKLVDSEERKLDSFDEFLGHDEKRDIRRMALEMTRNTVERERERLEGEKAYSKGLIDFDEYLKVTF